MSLTKVIRYVSWVTAIFSGSPLDPWGLRGTQGVPWSQTATSANQNISLTNVVRYVLGVTKNAFGVTPDPWGPVGTWGLPPEVKLKLQRIKKFR